MEIGNHELPAGVLIFNPQQSSIISANDYLAEKLGYKSTALNGQALSCIMDDAEVIALPKEASHSTRIRLQDNKGRNHAFVVSAKPLQENMCLVLLEESVESQLSIELEQDRARLLAEQTQKNELISKLESVNAQFVQTEKMAAIGQLAAGVAHEINNPIGYVYSNLQTLAGYLGDLRQIIEAIDQVSEIEELKILKNTLDYEFIRNDVSDLMSESAQGIERVKHIITALKDFSRSDDEKTESSDLQQALESTLSVVWNELKYKAEVETDYGELPLVECNLGQINQVFMNLLLNAAQSIDDFGIIKVSTRSLNNRVEIRVEDSGHGIEPEHRSRIFEPFFTTKPVGEGTGLGLPLAYNIIKKHGGSIELESTPGKGTAFTVSLPVTQLKSGR
ncbi:sensor histidine kinase [Aliidiomarina minuta]|nr:ATP-binding protein [Aliidiomarina minuta]